MIGVDFIEMRSKNGTRGYVSAGVLLHSLKGFSLEIRLVFFRDIVTSAHHLFFILLRHVTNFHNVVDTLTLSDRFAMSIIKETGK